MIEHGSGENVVPAWLNLGNVRIRLGDVEGAIAALRLAVDSDSNDVMAKATYALAGIYLDQGQRASAFEYYRRTKASGHPALAPRAEEALRALGER